MRTNLPIAVLAREPRTTTLARNRSSMATALLATVLLVAAPVASALKIELPADSGQLKPGPGVEFASNNCQTCHSVDYIRTQPSGKPMAFWKLEVEKMKKLYGAPIPDDQVEPIAKYLTQAYGDGK